ncbi:MAG: NUDIX hydrolase [Pseudomonadales bacterium]
MNYCSHCGHPVSQKIPAGDNRHRYVCDQCERIHYQNPRIIAGCVPVFEEKVLLCRRAIEPRSGYWTLPAGFLENGETTAIGAERETREEANANVEIIDLYTLFSLPHISQVYLFFRARLLDLDFSAGEETTEVRLFSEHEIPWDQLAFPVISQTLGHYFADYPQQTFPVRSLDIIVNPNRRPADGSTQKS